MNTELKDDPIYELRLYHTAPGRLRDMESRVKQDLCTLFPRHGVRPLGTWSVVAGPAAPLFVYLTPWRNMQQRTQSWAGFYADPAWAEARTRTNAGSELVERYEILFLRAVTDWAPSPASSDSLDSPLVEMVIQSVAIGQTAAVRNEILQSTVPALRAAGATVHGVFDVMSGYPLPSAVFFISWLNMEQRARTLEMLDLKTVEARTAGRAPLLERADQYLMRPVPVDWDEGK
jgi:hypothetical protein